VNLRRPGRACNEGSTGPKRLDDARGERCSQKHPQEDSAVSCRRARSQSSPIRGGNNVSEPRGNNLKAFKDFCPKAKARIRPCQSCMCHIRSIVETPAPHLFGSQLSGDEPACSRAVLALPHSGRSIVLRLTSQLCGTSPSTLARKRARPRQFGETRYTGTRIGVLKVTPRRKTSSVGSRCRARREQLE